MSDVKSKKDSKNQTNENLERNKKLLELRISEKRSNLKEKISGLINKPSSNRNSMSQGSTPGSMTARKKMRN